MIEQARPGQIALACELWEKWFAEEPPKFRSAKTALRLLAETWNRVTAETVAGVALIVPGAAVLLWAAPEDRKTLVDYGLFVERSARGSGLGNAMLARGFELGKQNGAERVLMSVDLDHPISGDWMRRLGCVPVQTVMVKEL